MYKVRDNVYPETSVSLLEVAEALNRIANEMHITNEIQMGFLRAKSETHSEDTYLAVETWRKGK